MEKVTGRMKIGVLMVGAAFLSTANLAQAQPSDDTFTFTSIADKPTVVGGNATSGNRFSGMYWTATSERVSATGKKSTAKFVCVGMTQPPDAKLFDMHMICDGADSNGTYSVTMGCNMIDEAKQNVSCIGGLYGKTGAYAGRRGTLTNHSIAGRSTGTGQWYR